LAWSPCTGKLIRCPAGLPTGKSHHRLLSRCREFTAVHGIDTLTYRCLLRGLRTAASQPISGQLVPLCRSKFHSLLMMAEWKLRQLCGLVPLGLRKFQRNDFPQRDIFVLRRTDFTVQLQQQYPEKAFCPIKAQCISRKLLIETARAASK